MIALSLSTGEQSVVSLKTCISCKADLPFNEFYKHPKAADGYLGKCKSCHRAFIANNRMKNLERIRQYDRDRAHLDKQGYFLVKAPMTPTKTSSLGGPNWFKEGEEDEADYDNEYQNMVKRMAKKAADQEQHRGPVDLADLARKLKALGQKDQD